MKSSPFPVHPKDLQYYARLSRAKGKLKKTWTVKSLRHGVFPGGHPSKY